MGIWRRWFRKSEHVEHTEPEARGGGQTIQYDEAQLRAELRHLLQQRQTLELRGCFSDRELDEKDHALERLDERIKALKSQQFRLRTYGKVFRRDA
jgi:hypothetical protein